MLKSMINPDLSGKKIFFITLIFCMVTVLIAETIYVPGDFSTINEAVAYAQNGDVICVADGIYNESVNYIGKDIIITSANGHDNCIITPPQNERAIIFENEESVNAKLIGFTITGASIQAVFIENASATIQDNLIINNQMGTWYFNGAGIYCSNSSAIIVNNEIAFNTEGYHGGGIYLDNWDGELINNEIHHNITNAGYGVDHGSGLCLMFSSGYVENNLIYGNDSNYTASSFCCYSTNSIIEHNQIIENENTGIKVVGNVMPIINNNDIYGNSQYDVCVNVVDSTEVIDFQYNYWGESTTNEMDSLPYPSNISVIWDIFDNEILAFVNYDNWLDSPITSIDNKTIFPQVDVNLVNYPNPFNPTTTISFSVTQTSSFVTLEIYNIKGQKVKVLSPSLCHPELVEGRGETTYSVIWNGDDESGKSVSSGLYFYKLNVNGKTKAVKKCLLLK